MIQPATMLQKVSLFHHNMDRTHASSRPLGEIRTGSPDDPSHGSCVKIIQTSVKLFQKAEKSAAFFSPQFPMS